MARLPQPGSDHGTWGAILNEFLAQAHKSDGTIKNNAVTAATIQDGTITEAKLHQDVQTKLNAVGGVDDLSDLGVTATATELNFVDGVTSNIQTQLNNKQAADPTLSALASHNTNGLLTQTAADMFTGRAVTGTTGEISVVNGSGVGGDPTISLDISIPRVLRWNGSAWPDRPADMRPTFFVGGSVETDAPNDADLVVGDVWIPES